MIIGMPLYSGFDILDVTGPYEMFHWAKFKIDIVAERAGPIESNGGLTILAPKAFADAQAWDVMWVPGGAPEALVTLMTDPTKSFLNFLVRKSSAAQITASVCEGALLLAAAGLLDGYVATTHWAFIPCLKERFPKVRVAPGHPRFQWDRDRLTGGGISSGLDEALALIERLSGLSTAQTVQQTTQYYPDPPVSSEIPPATTCPLPSV